MGGPARHRSALAVGSGFRAHQGDEPGFLVADTARPWQGQPASVSIDLPPMSTVLLGGRR
ncbi:MAG: hypothetical protein R2705_12185 [Ilumatobacteraceae bacterium]